MYMFKRKLVKIKVQNNWRKSYTPEQKKIQKYELKISSIMLATSYSTITSTFLISYFSFSFLQSVSPNLWNFD